MQDQASDAPMAVYERYLRAGQLAYQYSPGAQAAVFYPRLVCPFTGTGPLEWRVSAGWGTVHAVTVVHGRDGPQHNVVLVDLDEGFRIMSRVVLDDPRAARIGMRVRARIAQGEDGMPYPVFDPAPGAAHA